MPLNNAQRMVSLTIYETAEDGQTDSHVIAGVPIGSEMSYCQ